MRRCYMWIVLRTPMISQPLLRNSATTGSASTLRQGWRDWIHRVKQALTTSTRTRWNRTDIIDSKRYVWAHRSRIQKSNDVFHSAGKRGKTLSREALLLEFDGVEWSFIVLPASLALLIILVIALVDGRRRQERQQQELNFLRQRAESLESMRKEQSLTNAEKK
ncbi:uncharacterized protein TM35_000591090 [Trypanosoma theileri]|uniref:Uncharacterized protein n=1 Tax=Trypanosoma theileri TaxID=67003 RepID=A0A1X0NGB9_9TRYP|nr:uncharacterized protein TM35_000591090 [Trypanosoma theileri]ORC83717.1 hypothetical protein TM35_000591090 [Trypanosoma theileri]